MRTQQYREIEAIVAKYKKLASETEEVKRVIKDLDNYFPTDFNRLNFEEQLIIRVYSLAVSDDSVKPNDYYYITGLLDEAEEQYLVDNFAEFVDYIFDHTHGSITIISFVDDFDAPQEWSRLVPYLLENKSGKIYIGRSDKGREFADIEDCELTVGEGYREAYIRALSTGKSIERRSICGGKSEKDEHHYGELWYDIEDRLYDTAIIDIHHLHKGDVSFVNKCFKECCRIVKDGGEILLCVSIGDILSEESADIRERMTKERMLKEVIQLPSGNILLHIIKRPQESLVMCDTRQLSKKLHYGVVVDAEAFKREMEMAERKESSIVRHYEYERLDCNILIPMYYLHEGTPIAETVRESTETVLSDECDKGEKVATVNLSKMFANGEFKVEELPRLRQDRLRRYYKVNGPAVIMAVSKTDIAVGYTTDTAQFLVPENLYVLMPKEGIDVRYLAGKLLSKPIKEQIVALVCSYYGYRTIKTELVRGWEKAVRMDIVSLEEQQRFVQEVTMKEFAEQERESKAQEKSFRQAIRLRKHALIQNVSAFESLFRSLEYRMAEQNGAIKSTDRLSPVSQMTVGEAMEILHNDLATISYRIEHLTDENDWGKCEIIEPQEFIESYEKRHASSDFRFSYLWIVDEMYNVYDTDVYDKESGKLLHYKGEPMNAAWFPRRALEQVLDNIVANACAHGFKDKSRDDYAISIVWETDGLNMLIKISNNGEPLPADVDADLVLEYGYTTALNQNGHGGIGGGEIAEIMHKFGGNAKVISTPDETYTVTYVLSMPLANLY